MSYRDGLLWPLKVLAKLFKPLLWLFSWVVHPTFVEGFLEPCLGVIVGIVALCLFFFGIPAAVLGTGWLAWQSVVHFGVLGVVLDLLVLGIVGKIVHVIGAKYG